MDIDTSHNIYKRLGQIEKKLDDISVSGEKAEIYVKDLVGQNLKSEIIDLREVWRILWRGKWWIACITFLFSVASILIAISLPNVYRSEVLLAPAEENAGGGLAAMAGNLGGLASLAGINLAGKGNDKTALAIAVLKSRDFISKFVRKKDLLIPVIAGKEWDAAKNVLILDQDIYDKESKAWVRKVAAPRSVEPSLQEAYEEFMKLLSVSQDKNTGFVSVSVEFYSPVLAKVWVDELVRSLNDEIRQRDVTEAKKSIEYLTEQLNRTSLADMKTVFYELIEEQTKIEMFAMVRDEYVFKTIDPAVVAEQKSKPKRALIVLVGLLFGGVVSVTGIIFLYFLRPDS